MSVSELIRDLPMLHHPLPEFDPSDVPGAPIDLFTAWLGEAIAAGVDEPHAMTLSTVDDGGAPDARIVVLLDADADGFRFAARIGSPKVIQMEAAPQAALSFYWREQGRQVRVRGDVRDAGDEAAARDFLRRSPASRAANLAGRQSAVLGDLGELGRAFEAAARAEAEADPEHRLYVVAPRSVEFWSGSPDRRHRRLRYRRDGDGWARELLWP